MCTRFHAFCLFALLAMLPLGATAQLSFLKKSKLSNAPEGRLLLQVGAGVAAVKSDICKGWGCNNFGPQVSMGALYRLSPLVGVSGNVGYVRLGAHESNPRRPLDVSFQTDVIQATASAVVNLTDSYKGRNNYRSSKKHFVVPYLTAGVGVIYYNTTAYPGQGKLNDSYLTYEPTRDYPAIALVIPVGGGLRFRINDEVSIAPELVYHITATDYLDNDNRNKGRNLLYKDHYGVATVKLMYTPSVANPLFFWKRK